MPLLKALLITLACLILIFLRHPSQFIHPQIWAEAADIYSYASWSSLFDATTGYLCFSEKLLINIIIAIPFFSIESHPEVIFYATIILTCFIILYFQLTPSRLKQTGLFCLAIILSPHYGSEVFAKFLYLIWILPLSIFFLLFRDSKNLSRRVIYTDILLLVIAGLSGPVVLLLLPALLFTTMLHRNHYYYKLSIVAIICSTIQLLYLKNNPKDAIAPNLSIESFSQILEISISNFIPQYLLPGEVTGMGLGLVYLITFSCLVFSLKKKLKSEAIILAIVFISTSIPPILKFHPYSGLLLNPVTSGSSRYFFYPFLSITFYLLLVIINANLLGRILATSIISIALYNNAPGYQVSSFNFKWKPHIRYARHHNCNARIPVPLNGEEGLAWTYQSNSSNKFICSDYNLSNWTDREKKAKSLKTGKKNILINDKNRAVFIPKKIIASNNKTFANFSLKILTRQKENIKAGFIFLDSNKKEIKVTANKIPYNSSLALYNFSAKIPKDTRSLKPYIHMISNSSYVEISEVSLLLLK